ncbi:MAG: OmpH family outer membrane protein [Bacteroidota bacterium]
MTRLSLLLGLTLLASGVASAQMRIAHVDTEAVLTRLPEFQSAQQEVDRLTSQYLAEVDALVREGETLEQEFLARELLYTDQERQAKQDEIAAKKQEADALRRRYFGPDGELVRQQKQTLRPIQERVLDAVETVADEAGYDYVFDRAGEVVFLYAKSQHDLTDRVLDELGVSTSTSGLGRGL